MCSYNYSLHYDDDQDETASLRNSSYTYSAIALLCSNWKNHLIHYSVTQRKKRRINVPAKNRHDTYFITIIMIMIIITTTTSEPLFCPRFYIHFSCYWCMPHATIHPTDEEDSRLACQFLSPCLCRMHKYILLHVVDSKKGKTEMKCKKRLTKKLGTFLNYS